MKNQLFSFNQLILIITILGLFIIVTFAHQLYQSYTSNSTVESQAFCGVPDVHYSDNAIVGKKLFQNNCASCHATNMKSDATGPALFGVEERWADYPKADLYNWIRNSQAMIEENHPRANELWNEWQPVVMTSFTNLTDEDIEAILEYVNVIYYSDTRKTESQIIGCSF